MATKVHLDVDPGSDDAVMMAIAFGSPDIDVVGVSTVGGNSTVDDTTRNALSLVTAFDSTDVPVAKGASTPLTGTFDTVEWIHGENGIRGDVPDPAAETVDMDGSDLIIENAREYGDDLTIAAVGPMTNLAMALVREPDLSSMVDDIYLMGGAAMVSGNKTPMAEANFHNDAVAARRVIESGEPRMVGLDATHEATLEESLIDDWADRESPYDLVAAWLDYPEEIRAFGDGMDPAIHDAAVVAHLVDGEVLTFEPYHLDIDYSAGPSRGTVICDEHRVTENEPNGEVAVATDTERFRAVFHEAVDELAGE